MQTKKQLSAMNNITIIELLLVCTILILQTIQGVKTGNKIRFLAKILPEKEVWKIEKCIVSRTEISESLPDEIIARLVSETNEEIPTELPLRSKNEIEVSLINPFLKRNVVFDEIVSGLNVYLLRNQGAAADFNLVKDLVERNLDSEDDDIGQSITVPLYLGLIGTMLGIVTGLVNLFIFSDSGADFEVKGFLVGVSIAMFASLYGLGWTVYNSASRFKNARKKLDRAKNNFFTFIQIELLPVLNQSVSSSVINLNKNLVSFNERFSLNLNRLDRLLDKNHDAILAQENVMQMLEKIDLVEFAKANTIVFQKLKGSIESLSQFNAYLDGLNNMAGNSFQLSNSFNELLSRTNNFQDLGVKLDTRIEESNQLLTFLKSHFSELENNGLYVQDAVTKVNDIMAKSLDELKDFILLKMSAIKEITVKETDVMSKSMDNNKSHFAKLDLLTDVSVAIKNIQEKLAVNDSQLVELLIAIKASIEASAQQKSQSKSFKAHLKSFWNFITK